MTLFSTVYPRAGGGTFAKRHSDNTGILTSILIAIQGAGVVANREVAVSEPKQSRAVRMGYTGDLEPGREAQARQCSNFGIRGGRNSSMP